MKKMKIKEFWMALGRADRNKLLFEVSQICQISIQTVQAWMLKYRTPKGLNKDALSKYIRENYNTEII